VKVLITGGCGFIGSYVARDLISMGHQVTVLDIREPALLEEIVGGDLSAAAVPAVHTADVTDVAAVVRVCQRRGIDAIVHLAGLLTGPCAEGPTNGARVNIGGTSAVFEAADILSIQRLVWTGSISVFGHIASRRPLPDNAAHSVDSFYSLYHSVNEQQARVYFETRGIASTGLRIAFGYGYGRARGRGSWVSELLSKPPLGVDCRIWGGDVEVPWLYVEDASSAIIAALLAAPDGCRMLNTAGQVRWKQEAVDIVRRLAPGVSIVIEGDSDGYPTGMDDSTLRSAFGWTPRFTLETSLCTAFNRYRRAAGLAPVSL
jgi:UDP-glucose 4-epimerase